MRTNNCMCVHYLNHYIMMFTNNFVIANISDIFTLQNFNIVWLRFRNVVGKQLKVFEERICFENTFVLSTSLFDNSLVEFSFWNIKNWWNFSIYLEIYYWCCAGGFLKLCLGFLFFKNAEQYNHTKLHTSTNMKK